MMVHCLQCVIKIILSLCRADLLHSKAEAKSAKEESDAKVLEVSTNMQQGNILQKRKLMQKNHAK
jgi:hypothetical protein